QDCSYDLYLRTSDSSLFRLDRGVTLTGDGHIAWSSAGRPDRAKLASIAGVRLQTGGSWGHPTGLCEIRLRDDVVLTVNSARPIRTGAETQDALYRDFVRDLHRRLTALDVAQVQFRAGYSERQFQIIALMAFLAAFMFIVLPMVLLALTRKLWVLGFFL